ncbi:MAG: hypothetical protein MJ119_02235 [Lachnospiraceae bacterium]|nr:hypothetical protein [Lachnospiraceae bacterium]
MRVLTILEVSQKQAYIFASNELKKNIENSSVIAYVLSPEYIEKTLKDTGYSDKDNMVYAGGGHTILTFADKEKAIECTAKLTGQIYKDFDSLNIFAKTIEYDESKTVKDNLSELTKGLEAKKALRKAAFHQGSFGIEAIDSRTLLPVDVNSSKNSEDKEEMIKINENAEKKYYPEEYNIAYKFEDLGGSKSDSNFISVVHIDGNGMGKRVDELYEHIDQNDFDAARKKLRDFSESIDRQFKESFKEMAQVIANNLQNGSLRDGLSLKKKNFPIRKVIIAGDDVCFVTEGRIGIECAVQFIKCLNKKQNEVDKKGYAACAGVAVVHQKYPFFKAYELAESLCSNAKSFNATIHPDDNGQSLSSIDWHIEYGEIGDSVDDIRETYKTADNNRLEMRPYIISGPDDVMNKMFYNTFSQFRKVMKNIMKTEGNFSTGKIKELRNALKLGEVRTKQYIAFNLMDSILVEGKELTEGNKSLQEAVNKDAFVEGYDGVKHSILFDAIELMDTYIMLEEV